MSTQQPEDIKPPTTSTGSASIETLAQRPVSPASSRLPVSQAKALTPRAQTATAPQDASIFHTPKAKWTQDQIEKALRSYIDEVAYDTASMVEYVLETAEAQAPERRHVSAIDPFADMKSIALSPDESPDDDGHVIIRFKQYNTDQKPKKNGTKAAHPVISLQSDKQAVPKYRFHHVEISKNVLAPNTMLNFVPHLIDVDPNSKEERQYLKWLTELDNLDTQSGFKTSDRNEKAARARRDEWATRLSLYLDDWIQRLAIDGCTRSTLIRLMANDAEKDDAITPQQKSSILDTYHDAEDTGSPQAEVGAKMFTEAFNNVFGDSNSSARSVQLRDVLFFDKSVQTIVDNNRAKDTPSSQKTREVDWLPKLETALGSYAILGCWICFSHDCQHGEFDADNQRRTFSVESTGGVGELLKRRWAAQAEANRKNLGNEPHAKITTPCKNQCYCIYDVGNPAHPVDPWSEGEIQVLESVFVILGHGSCKAQCEVAALLGRKCWEVYKKMKELDLELPDSHEPPTEQPKVKPVSWYDRKKKALLGDWQDATVTHEHANKRLIEPCHHDGPCTAAKGCPCASENPPVLCERFCQCTEETCALKFTGCACHSMGKTCFVMKKEGKPCICVQLNRECDPVLCKGCGAAERADPENAHDEVLHSTGCQNVVLQRGLPKAVMIGQSQLEGCGYGLFTAEDIAAEEFVIEYTGELITHDEGVRREARRGDVFNEEKSSSYLFTLLENEGIWVDAAIYGNLSRYINHDKIGANITPKIQYVNGEYRIKFTALHNIKAGEELFFNYGDNFPNLTKKLLEDGKEGGAADAAKKGKGGRPRKNPASVVSKVKRKSKGVDFASTKKPAGGRGKARKTAPNPGHSDDDGNDFGELPPDHDDEVWNPGKRRTKPSAVPKVVKKRGGARPGAGRKKKSLTAPALPVPKSPDVPSTGKKEDSRVDTKDDSISAPVGPSPAGSAASFDPGFEDSPSGRRSSKRIAVVRSLLPTHAEPLGGDIPRSEESELQIQPLLKPKSNRGGARPGAGRKPKKLKQRMLKKQGVSSPAKTETSAVPSPTPAKNPLEEESDYTPDRLARLFASGSRSSTRMSKIFSTAAGDDTPSRRGPSRPHKRKADEIEDSDDEVFEHRGRRPRALQGQSPFKVGGFALRTNYDIETSDISKRSDNGSASRAASRASRSSEDTDEVLVRSSRKRVKPAKYRDDEDDS
ncbi:hypothetical protein GQ53DRAFT_670636 [Thozetella sp. PMI_491]|nr:hypothetical protein GQ53DRAFT_670636 [Thozetella sp. PMI_491]